MPQATTFKNERGNDIELRIEPGPKDDELTAVMVGPSSTVEHTFTELEAIKLALALRRATDARRLHRRLIGSLTARARELGYALAVHGSRARDIDLIAVAWTDAAVPARELAEALRVTAGNEIDEEAVNIDAKGADNPDHFHHGMPGHKPHGRLVWCFHLGGSYIDLSVIPPLPAEPAD